MTVFITSIPHEHCTHFRSDEKFHHDENASSFDDICRSLVLPSEAKVVDRSGRVALHTSLLRNCLMRGDRAALHTSLLRTWKAFSMCCCSRVVSDPPVFPIVRDAHNHCQTLSLHLHRSTFFKHSRPHHSFRLKRLFCICVSTDQPKVFQCQASISVLHSCVCQRVFGCAPLLGSSRCVHAELGSGART